MQLPDNFIAPDYNGRSIANVPATVAAAVGVSIDSLPPLQPSLWQPVAQDTNRVVVLILDAFGWNLLQAYKDELAPLLNKATILEQITSIFPSTTSAALSSLWSGFPPTGHGLMGLHLFLPQFAAGTQMISFTPVFDHIPDALIHAGLDLEKFLLVPGLAEQLAVQGIPTYAFKGREIVNSALSKMHGRGVASSFGAFSFADMLVQMGDLLHEKAGEPLYACGYWPTIDTLSHFRDWTGTAVKAELLTMFQQINAFFLQRLTDAAKAGTAFFIVADHGQTSRNMAQQVHLEDHPQLMRDLIMRPMGDGRVAYLYTRQGRQTAVLDYFATNLADLAVALPVEEALATGWFGAHPISPIVRERMGDVVVIMRDQAILYTNADQFYIDHFYAGHGGLTADEMQVPWIGFHLPDL